MLFICVASDSVVTDCVSFHMCVEFIIRREEKHGGDLTFPNYQALEDAFARKEVYPLDLKNAVTEELNKVSNLNQCGCSAE